MSQSYIPSRDSDLKAWADNFSTVFTADYAALGFLVGDATAIATKVSTYDDAFNLAGTVDRVPVNPGARTTATIAAMATAKADMIAFIRPFASAIIRNPAISDEQKAELGVTVPDPNKTVIAPPTDQVTMTIAIPGTLQQKLQLRASSTPSKKAKPVGSTGCVIFGATSETIVTDPAVLPFIRVATRSDITIDIDASKKGKTMYYAARWFNAKGQPGPYSSIYSSVVA